jgi:hypothetical protein
MAPLIRLNAPRRRWARGGAIELPTPVPGVEQIGAAGLPSSRIATPQRVVNAATGHRLKQRGLALRVPLALRAAVLSPGWAVRTESPTSSRPTQDPVSYVAA